MLRSILIGIDPSDCGIAVQELGVRWAKRLGAQLAGLSVVDEPGIHQAEEMMFGEAFHRPVGQTMVAEARRKVVEHLGEAKNRFRLRCQEAGVDFRLLDEIGAPHLQILLEAQEHDVVILGQRSHFEYGRDGEPDQTVGKVIQDSPRPVVVVPDRLVGFESVVIAYDGSVQASRVLQAFESSGLGRGMQVHVVAVDADRRDAAHRALRAIAFLSCHEIEATSHIVETSSAPADAILKKVRSLDAGLLVMGAYGQPVLREFFLGSVTRTMLKECPVPVFCFH
jgi:nucleotide-binding universal stress UspA family protein